MDHHQRQRRRCGRELKPGALQLYASMRQVNTTCTAPPRRASSASCSSMVPGASRQKWFAERMSARTIEHAIPRRRCGGGALHTAANDDGGGITGAYHFLSPLLSLAFPCFSIYAACSIAAQPK
jgi:hypothetical protein